MFFFFASAAAIDVYSYIVQNTLQNSTQIIVYKHTSDIMINAVMATHCKTQDSNFNTCILSESATL